MRQRIVDLAARPAFWLGLLLTWVFVSALRSWHTPWERASLTEALRWGAGIGLALFLGRALRRTTLFAQAVTVGLGELILMIVLDGPRPGGYVTGPYGDHQLCADALLVLLPFSTALALTAPRPAWRNTAQIIALAAALCLALTHARAAWLGSLAGAGVFLVFWLRREHLTAGRKLLVPALLTAATLLVFVINVQHTEMGQPLTRRAATLFAVDQDGSWRGRLDLWRVAVQMVAARPWLGWGVGHYPYAHWAYAASGLPLALSARPSLTDQAHDFYLQTAVDLGLAGLALYLAAMASFIRLAVHTLWARAWGRGVPKRPRSRDALLIASLAMLAAQGVDALASPSWQYADVSLLFWLGLGLGMAACRDSVADAEAPLPSRLRRTLRSAAAAAAGLVLVAVAVPAPLLPPALAAGLVTPLDSYGTPNLTLSPASVIQTWSVLNDTVTYHVVLTNSDGSQTNENAATTFSVNSTYSYFTAGGTGLLIVAKADKGKTLTVTATTTIDGQGYVTTATVLMS